MKKTLCMIVVSFFTYNIWAQDNVKIDGSITLQEGSDTTYYKAIADDDFIIFKESKDNYYLGIRSNYFTIASVYIYDGQNTLKILHASYSLGTTEYKKTDQWQPIEEYYEWDLRDPLISNEETMHTLEEQYEAFYKANLWVANTAPQGSYRDMEFLISKDLFNEDSKFAVAYKRKVDGNVELKYWPTQVQQCTQSLDIDEKIFNGYLPEDVMFRFNNFCGHKIN